MIEATPDEDRVEQILRECLERPESSWPGAVDEACLAHPDLAAQIRKRFESLRAFGMVDESFQPRKFGPFTLIRPLGSGATATVYMAQRDGMETIALKILHTDLLQSGVALQRFDREVDLASRLDDPGICRVLETGSIDGVPYLAMTHIEGSTLAQRIIAAGEEGPSRSRSDIEKWVQIIEGVARSLHVAHAAGLVHRDVKPANIMVGDNDQPVLMDLGLAADAEAQQSLTLPGTLLGTPVFMAPEAIRGERRADRRSDVYSLGVSLFECLTLQDPWTAPTREALFHQVLHSPTPNASRVNPHIDGDLSLLVCTAMARDPDLRYDSAQALANDLARWRAGRRLSVRRPNVPVRVGRWVRGNRMATAFVLALALGLTATVAFLLESQAAWSRASALALASAASQTRMSDPELAVLLARTAVQRYQNPATVSELHTALADLHTWTEIPADQAELDEGFPGGFGTHPAVDSIEGYTGNPLDLTSDGTLLLTSDPEDVRRALLWEVNGERATSLGGLEGHEDRLSSAWFSPDGSRILTASTDQTARVWDLRGRELHRLPRHGCIVHAARFSPDGELVITGGGDGIARLFDAAGHPLTEFRGHGGLVDKVAIDRDRTRVATASHDGTVRIWSLQAPGIQLMAGGGRALVAGTITDDGRLITVDRDERLQFQDSRGAPLTRPPEIADAHALLTVEGQAIIARDPHFNEASMWDSRGQLLGRFEPDLPPIRAAALGSSLLVTVGGSKITWWSRADEGPWRPAREVDVGRTVTTVDLHPDGKLVACGCEDGTVLLYGDTEEPLAAMANDQWVWTVRFSPDGQRLLTASRDNTARIFDLDGNELLRLTGHGGTVLCAAFSPSGGIATASVDHTVRLWSSTGSQLAILRGHTGQVRHVAFSPDGRRLLSSSADTTARIWLPLTVDLLALANTVVSRDFTLAELQRYGELLGR